MAEKEGFEPSIPFWGIHDFQSCALGQLRDFSMRIAHADWDMIHQEAGFVNPEFYIFQNIFIGGGLAYRSRTPAFSHASTVCLSHTLDCTSPIWQHPIISIARRDCPMPPPMVRGSSSFRSIWWKGSCLRSSQPDSVS